MWFRAAFFFTTQIFIFWSANAIVGAIPGDIPVDHPASYNTIALVKKLSGDTNKYKIFCSGFIVSQDLILTAKHCLGDLQKEDYLIYFGDDTNNINPQLLRTPTESSIYGPKDWKNYFPSFDSAWVRFSGGLPSPHFRPVPLLINPSWIDSSTPLFLAGYGNQSAELMQVIAGEKKYVATSFKKYMNTKQVASLVLLQGKKGHNNCHGDSGGPAYAQIQNPVTGQKEWYVIGSASGFDVALTPNSYEKKDDDLFPYVAYCDRSQTLYTFVGDYASWIEKSTGETLLKSNESFLVLNPGKTELPEPQPDQKSFQDWCEQTTFDHPAWLTVRKLLVDAMEQKDLLWPQEEIFLNCEIAEKALSRMSSIRFKEGDYWGSLQPLSTLPIEELHFYKTQWPDLSTLSPLQLKKITLRDMKIPRIDVIRGLTQQKHLVYLDISGNSLVDLENIQYFTELEYLNISWNQLRDISLIANTKSLVYLDFSSNLVKSMSSLYGLDNLEILIGSNNQLIAEEAPLGTWKKLKKVYLINNQLTHLHFLKDATSIQHSNFKGNPFEKIGSEIVTAY